MFKKLAFYSLVAVLGFTGIACGGGSGSSSGGDDTPQALAASDSQQAVSNASTAAFQAYGAAAASLAGAPPALIKAVAIDPVTVNCTPSGTVSVSGDVESTDDSFSMDLVLAYDACGGLDGDLNLTAEVSVAGSDLEFILGFDGTLNSDDCDVTFSEFTEELNFTDSAYSYVLDGDISSTCDGTTVTCSFDNETVDVTDTDAFEDNCVES